MTELLFAGDLCPIGINESVLSNRSSVRFAEARSFFDRFDFVTANLEAPLTDENTPIFKSGPNLRANTRVALGIKELGVTAVSLANNHIYDHGEVGMESTLVTLREIGIGFGGQG